MTHWVDCAYSITGAGVERDYPADLFEALRALAPWLDDEPLAGVHPLRGLTPAAGSLLLGGRSRLLLRVPESRIDACEQLQGRSLDLPSPLAIGRASCRELLAHPVLHAKLVFTGTGDEAGFVADVEREIASLGFDCEIIVGRRGEVRVGGEALAGFSLMLHGLPPEQSLIAQAHGVGLHRKYGCGVFVPHKSVAAVGL
jgi:CRISPR-associated protein Cas6